MREKKGKKACSIDVGKILVFGLLILLLSGSAASASDTGWVVPSSNTGGSGVTNPQNAYASDTSYAQFAANGNYWNWYGYVLSSIPAGSTIDGIEVNARGVRQSGCSSNCLMRLRLSYDSGTSWTSYINTATWTNSNIDHILGGPTNNWGRSWTRDEIVNSFRVQALWQVASGTYYGNLDYLPVRVYYTAGAASTYNISGYITNASSGLPLNGAAVQTNTTLSTTTNAQGYYIFTGLSNGTYLINASLTGYAINSTARTISGANLTNVNLSLSPVPTYILSGYVKNASNSAAISGATVTTNTTLSTITDGTGYYAFTLSNGNYLITASKTNYNSNSITRTVNGAAVNNADISLTATPSSGTGQIIVATNRFVVLDDPLTTGKTAQTAAGFALPSGTGWSLNTWSSAQTTIKGYALVLDDNGNPIKNTPVIFTIRNWDSLDKTTSTAINTDTNGIANYSLDLNAKNYYGNWYIDANATALGKSSSTGFIYNWFGCNSGGCRNHGSDSPGTATPSRQNSPYTLGRETITANGNHASITDTDCVGCHRSYGGTGGGQTFSGQPTKTADVHVTNTCATCHATIATHDTNEPIKSCTDCHSWTNLSREYTMSNGTTPMSNYSGNVAATGHNPNSTILCIICHGPMHNITKPDESLRMTKNNIVEDSHCLTCHTSYNKHNGGVGCTLCHSQDVHAIQVLSRGAGYVNKGSTYQGDCTNCHQNATFFNTLKLAPKAGAYTGVNPPQVQIPLNHSNDPLAGQKWNNYWASGTSGSAQLSACAYCHSSTQHDLNALGRPSQFDGNNVVGSTISSTTYWCSSCHWQGYTSGANNYNDMVNIFISLMVPPEITGHSTYGANQSKPGYFNHSNIAKDDASCQVCHGGLTPSTNITGLLHNVYNVSEGSPSPPQNITLNQSIGVYDTRVDKYTESLCRYCHNSTYLGGVRTRHHNLVGNQINPTNGQPFSCQDCHPNITVNGNQQPLYDRNCINCHNGSAFWGNTLGAQVNITRPHHINTSYDSAGIGQPAQERQCNVCHGSFIANFNDSHYIPSYNTSFMITPYADFKAYNATSGKYWGGCYACHQNSSSESPVIMTQHDTHHGAISGWGGIGHQKDSTPGSVCTWCHLSLDVQNATVKITINGTEETVIELRNSTLMAADIANAAFEPGTTMPINGTACEKCHSVQSIHNIQVINNGQSGNGHIGNNSDCNGCHASWIAGAAPMQRAIIPSMDSITPSVVLAGSVNHITITGLNFVNDAYTSVVSVDGVTYTPTSITDTQIVVNIPALSPGVHTLQLVKEDAKSKLATLTAVTQTTVASAKLASGSITITGANFGPKPDPAFSDLGVFITHTVKGRPETFRATIISWSENSIVVDAGTAAVNDQLTVKDLNGQASTRVNKGK